MQFLPIFSSLLISLSLLSTSNANIQGSQHINHNANARHHSSHARMLEAREIYHANSIPRARNVNGSRKMVKKATKEQLDYQQKFNKMNSEWQAAAQEALKNGQTPQDYNSFSKAHGGVSSGSFSDGSFGSGSSSSPSSSNDESSDDKSSSKSDSSSSEKAADASKSNKSQKAQSNSNSDSGSQSDKSDDDNKDEECESESNDDASKSSSSSSSKDSHSSSSNSNSSNSNGDSKAKPSASTSSQAPKKTPTKSKDNGNDNNSGNSGSGILSGLKHIFSGGQGTFFAPGLGSCGGTDSDTDYIVALSAELMDQFSNGNPNTNPLCNKKIKVEYQGKEVEARVTDTCPPCSLYSIDFSPVAFNQLSQPEVGRISGLKWGFVDGTQA